MSFHSINWLYAGIAATVAVCALFAWGERRRKRLLAEFASAKLLPELSRTVSPAKKFVKKTLLALGIFAVFAALARPQWGYHWAESKTRGIDIIFAIDTSKSMLAEDVKPSRLERAKLSVLDLLDVLDGDRIGIVAFSGQAFLQCPLTLDYDAFRLSLEALDTNVIQRGGTNIAAAISEADVAFEKTANHKIVVLISDGEELEASAVARAKQAAKDGVVIYTLGVGGAKGEPIPVRDASGRLVQLRDENGKIVASKLNEAVLSEIAKSTGGFYEPLSANGMDAIYENGLKKIPQRELYARMKQLAIERFQIPLAAAIILLALESLVGTRRFFAGGKSGKLAALAFAAVSAATLFAPQDARAESTAPDSQNAQTAPSEKTANAADAPKKPKAAPAEPKNPSPREIFNSGVDLLENGDTATAREKFLDAIKAEPDDFALHSKAFYNIANADYADAKHSLATAESAGELGAKAAQLEQAEASAMSGGTVLLQQGAPLLQKELEAVKAAKTDGEKKKALETSPLKDKQFQQSLKQGIAQCEAVEKQSAELAKNASQNLEKWNNAEKILDDSIGGYKSAAELDPSFTAAKNNLQSALVAKKNLDNETSKIKKLSDALSSDAAKQRLARVEKLKNELKKLVRDDNNQNQDKNQNQQQNQNQNQNQNQDKNQSQNQDKQQNQNQQQNDQNNQQQNGEQNKQNKQNDKQDKQQNDKQNKDSKEQNSEKQNDKQNSSDKNNGSQNGERKDKPQNDAEQNRDEQAVDNKKPQEQNGKQEQPQSPEKQGQNKPEQNAGNEERELPAEQKQAEKKQASAAQAAEKDGGKDSENYRSAVGAMTKGEARQLLESMKDSDKVLPLRGYGEQRNRFEKSYKDW